MPEEGIQLYVLLYALILLSRSRTYAQSAMYLQSSVVLHCTTIPCTLRPSSMSICCVRIYVLSLGAASKCNSNHLSAHIAVSFSSHGQNDNEVEADVDMTTRRLVHKYRQEPKHYLSLRRRDEQESETRASLLRNPRKSVSSRRMQQCTHASAATLRTALTLASFYR